MALIRFGAGIVGMAGSIGGTTFARNRSGSYARAKVKPINPATALQTEVREVIADLTTRWSSVLTPVQRTAWNLYAASVAMKNRLGESIYLSGFNHYIRSNANLKKWQQTLIAAGPTVFELPSQDPTATVAISLATQLATLTFDNTQAWATTNGGFLYLFQGSPQNPQRNFFAGPWRSLGKINGDTGAPPTSPKTFAVPFAVALGQRVWIYARAQTADGRLSEPFRANCFVGA